VVVVVVVVVVVAVAVSSSSSSKTTVQFVFLLYFMADIEVLLSTILQLNCGLNKLLWADVETKQPFMTFCLWETDFQTNDCAILRSMTGHGSNRATPFPSAAQNKVEDRLTNKQRMCIF
jgi:hypothetical protein